MTAPQPVSAIISRARSSGKIPPSLIPTESDNLKDDKFLLMISKLITTDGISLRNSEIGSVAEEFLSALQVSWLEFFDFDRFWAASIWRARLLLHEKDDEYGHQDTATRCVSLPRNMDAHCNDSRMIPFLLLEAWRYDNISINRANISSLFFLVEDFEMKVYAFYYWL